MGGDRECVMFAGLCAAALIFIAQDLRATIYGLALWFAALFFARLAAKSDPLLRFVYGRQLIKYRKYYPARSTPYRENKGEPYK